MSLFERTLVAALHGFKESTRRPYPCHWCGTVTPLLDAEDFHVCEEHQIEYARLGYAPMKAKFPLAGKNERNPQFFTAQAQAYRERAQRLTKRELRLIHKRGAGYDKDAVEDFRKGTISDEDLEFLGSSAEQYIDDWGRYSK